MPDYPAFDQVAAIGHCINPITSKADFHQPADQIRPPEDLLVRHESVSHVLDDALNARTNVVAEELLTVLLGLWSQVFPLGQDHAVDPVDDAPVPMQERQSDIAVVEAKDSECEDALSKIKEDVKEDEFQIETTLALHYQSPQAKGNSCWTESKDHVGIRPNINVIRVDLVT